MNDAIFWVIEPWHCLATCYSLVSCSTDLRSWRWRWYVPPKRRSTYRLHGDIFQKMATFMSLHSFYLRLWVVTHFQRKLKMPIPLLGQIFPSPFWGWSNFLQEFAVARFELNNSTNNTWLSDEVPLSAQTRRLGTMFQCLHRIHISLISSVSLIFIRDRSAQ
jgi:hypothetical protein